MDMDMALDISMDMGMDMGFDVQQPKRSDWEHLYCY
jgi:hypothetical protein